MRAEVSLWETYERAERGNWWDGKVESVKEEFGVGTEYRDVITPREMR